MRIGIWYQIMREIVGIWAAAHDWVCQNQHGAGHIFIGVYNSAYSNKNF